MTLKTCWNNFANGRCHKTRREFEKRAQLYQLLRDLKRFVQLKVDFFQTYGVHYFKKVGEKE